MLLFRIRIGFNMVGLETGYILIFVLSFVLSQYPAEKGPLYSFQGLFDTTHSLTNLLSWFLFLPILSYFQCLHPFPMPPVFEISLHVIPLFYTQWHFSMSSSIHRPQGYQPGLSQSYPGSLNYIVKFFPGFWMPWCFATEALLSVKGHVPSEMHTGAHQDCANLSTCSPHMGTACFHHAGGHTIWEVPCTWHEAIMCKHWFHVYALLARWGAPKSLPRGLPLAFKRRLWRLFPITISAHITSFHQFAISLRRGHNL